MKSTRKQVGGVCTFQIAGANLIDLEIRLARLGLKGLEFEPFFCFNRRLQILYGSIK